MRLCRWLCRWLAAVWLAGAWLAGASLWAQDALLEWLNQEAQQHLAAREAAIAKIRTQAEAEERKKLVRQRLLEILGGLPEYQGPLRARVTGALQSETHTIEKVIFESLPGFYVTGNLYRPKARGRYPAVLVPAGHTQEGKPEAQVLAANLAAKGYIALTYDPIGQGEREQSYLPQLGRALSGGGGNEHLELGARSMLIRQSVARYFIHDARRAVDYLVSRTDVDAERIGVTGCSGGGAIATYAAVFDARIRAAAPGCFLSTFRQLFTGPTPDSEMSLPSFLARGLDQADFFEVAAPLPWLLMATEEDYFTPANARPVYEEARRWYKLYGAEDRIRWHVGPGPHGTPKEAREEIYRWMNRWLREGKGEERDQEVKLFTNRELRVTASGNVEGEAGSRKLHQILLEEYRGKRKTRDEAALRAELERLGVKASRGATPVRRWGREGGAEWDKEEIEWESEPGIPIRGRLYLPKKPGRKGAVIVLEEKRMPVPLYVQRSASTNALAEAMAKAGRIVLEMETRDSPAAYDGRPFLGNWLTNERADLVGRNLAAMRAKDVLSAVDLLAAREDVDAAEIRGYGRGVKGFWLMLAAAVDGRLRQVWLDRTPWRFRLAMEAPLASFLFEALIPGFALHWDLDDLERLIGEKRIYWTDPTNWMNQVTEAGTQYRYRLVGEGDAACLAEFWRK